MATLVDRPVNRVLEHLPEVRLVSDDQWEARCPAHDDSKPSLSISVGQDDRALLKCHAGCELDAILSSIGLAVIDLHVDRERTDAAPTIRYPYVDEDGRLLFEVVRTVDKRFWQQSPGPNGDMRPTMKGVRRVLYRLPEVVAAAAIGSTIWIAEGEKDVDRLASLGITATCNPGGAGKWARVPDAPVVLAGADVVVVADRDQVGIEHAKEIAASLRSVGCTVRLVQARVGKDVSDHLDARLAIDDLDDIEMAPDSTAGSVFAFKSGGSFVLDIPDGVPAVWGDGDQVLWAEGEPLIIAGPPGVGKSTLLSNVLRARLGLAGDALGYRVAVGERVLYLACDRPAQIARLLKRRYSEAERSVLDDRLVVWPGPLPGDLAKDPALLGQMAAAAGADTVMIDSLKDVAMKLSDDDVGAAVNQAIQKCVADGVQIAALHHTRKASSGGGQPKALDDLYGSRWLTAGAGSVIVLWGEAGDPVVELLHRKQPAGKVGPLKIEHDPDTGRCSVVDAVDPSAVLLAAGAEGVDTPRFAQMLTGTTPTPASRKKALRILNQLVADEAAHVDRAGHGGSGGSASNRYRAACFGAFTPSDAVSDDPGADHAKGRHGTRPA